MKKIFAIIFLLCGIVGDVFADCVPTEVSGGIDKDHYLFSSDPNNKKTALICARGNCDNGEIVYAKSGHYRGKNKQDKAKIYKCSRGVNDKWEVYDDSYLNTVSTVCSGNSGGGVQIFSDVNNPNGQVQGSIQDSNLITNICVMLPTMNIFVQ